MKQLNYSPKIKSNCLQIKLNCYYITIYGRGVIACGSSIEVESFTKIILKYEPQ